MTEGTGRSAVRRVAVARGISLTGSGAAFAVLAYIVYRLTGDSAIWLSMTLLLTMGVQGLVQPFASWLGDRFDRRRVLVISDLCAAAGFVALAFARTPGQLVAIAVDHGGPRVAGLGGGRGIDPEPRRGGAPPVGERAGGDREAPRELHRAAARDAADRLARGRRSVGRSPARRRRVRVRAQRGDVPLLRMADRDDARPVQRRDGPRRASTPGSGPASATR